MSTFTDRQRKYLEGQLLGRLATVGSGGRPHVVPTGFRLDVEEETIDIGGYGVEATKKFRDAARHPAVAFVVDDLLSVQPWHARGVEVRGEAQTFTQGGERLGPGFGAAWIRIVPDRVVDWGLDDEAAGGEAR